MIFANCRKADHPRMRGEHVLILFSRHTQDGSSPHARGALNFMASRSLPTRIIPACAGSTINRETSEVK